jgi:mannose-6-phosphate isomerase
MPLYPLKFNPIPKTKLWGGNKLIHKLNKPFQEENIGESWEISDVKNNETTVSNGSLSGKTLKELIDYYKGELVGQGVYKQFGNKFPLLIKFIDAKTPLSIQVHPHDNIAKELHDSFGKNEMWYIMDTEKDAEIIVGFNQQMNSESYMTALESGKIMEVLNTVKTKPGDAFHIPTGRVHAIGGGIVLAEIQQTSDITYRIYDFDRVDATTGQTRELHNDLAKNSIDFTVHEEYKTAYNCEYNKSNKLIHTSYFTTNIIPLTKNLIKDYCVMDSFVILICVEGRLKLKVREINYSLCRGETILIPAIINSIELIPEIESKLLEVFY